MSDGQEPEKTHFIEWERVRQGRHRPARSCLKIAVFPKSRSGENSRKMPLLCDRGQKGEFMRTGLTKQEKTTDIWFDEKDPLIHIRTHNTDLKKRLAAYAGQHPDQCRQTDADPETGCMEFDIAKGRFSFRLTAPYSEERRNAASKAAKKHSGNLTHPIQKDML